MEEKHGEKSRWKLFIEDISVLQLVLSFLLMAVSCLVLMIYLMFTPLWPIPTLYFTWQLVDWDSPERGFKQTQRKHVRNGSMQRLTVSPSHTQTPDIVKKWQKNAFVRRWRVWKHFKDYFPVKLVKTAELNPSKNYILGCHPHGIMSIGAFSCFNTDTGGFEQMFPGMHSSLAILAGLFRIPLFREYVMSAGLLPVSKAALGYMLSQKGVGNAIVIIIGGAEESLASSPGINTVVMKHRKALFVSLWRTVGSPISVPHVCNPSEQQVDHYHKLYMESLSKLFHAHKSSSGLADTHQLRII
ncbi:hypothetical protein HF521_013686 [Silurus meridionalis]|uniref:Acyltransferase n=1 Tax=Silurus meridionalis TaxID=175797 RepID=A0A8T0AC75_SILME|nr:hypothetical protein HF521_013686 [Silurus meridionalis]